MNINYTDHTGERLEIHPQLKMIQEFYNGTNSIFVANDGVIKKTVYKEKRLTFSPITPFRDSSGEWNPLKYVISQL